MIEIRFSMPDLLDIMRKRKREIDLAMAAAMQANRGMLFDSEGKYNGRPGWAPLAFRSGMILSKRGVLRKSIAPPGATGQAGADGIVEFSGDTVTIGTRLGYARMMNDGTVKMPGGVLRPVKAKALKIPVDFKQIAERETREGGQYKTATLTKDVKKRFGKKGSGNFIFRKSVRIPARPFDDWNTMDEDELNLVLAEKIAQVLNGER